MPAATIRFQTTDGTWEVGGKDRKAGIVPENVKYGADQYGSTTCSFDLKRDPGAIWPDLLAFTPIEIEVGGVVVWEGRIKETPSRDSASESSINVQGEGWQYHLDDDLFQKGYVYTRMNDLKDMRTWPGETINRIGTAAGATNVDGGVATFGWPKGAQLTHSVSTTGPFAGFYLDLGPNNGANRVVINWTKINSTPATGYIGFFAYAGYTPDPVSVRTLGVGAATGYEPIGTDTDIASLGSSGTRVATVSNRRYVVFFLEYMNISTDVTLGEDNMLRVDSIYVFTDPAYEGSNTSVFKASQGITDALTHAPLLSSDRSGIVNTAFNIPDYRLDDYRTPRESIDALNAYHNYQFYIGRGARPIYRPRPATPILEVGAQHNATIEDASANSGADIYNKVIVSGTGPDGQPVAVERKATQFSGARLARLSTPKINAEPYSDSTGAWYTSNGTVTTDTVIYDSAPNSGKWSGFTRVSTGTGAFIEASGLFQQGNTYRIVCRVRAAGGSASQTLSLMFGHTLDLETQYNGWPKLLSEQGPADPGDFAINRFSIVGGAGGAPWTTLSVDWIPRKNYQSYDFLDAQNGLPYDQAGPDSVTLAIAMRNVDGNNTVINFDSFEIYQIVPTLADRRRFIRAKHLPVDFPVTSVAGQQLADTYLTGHTNTPFKGSVTLEGQTAASSLPLPSPVLNQNIGGAKVGTNLVAWDGASGANQTFTMDLDYIVTPRNGAGAPLLGQASPDTLALGTGGNTGNVPAVYIGTDGSLRVSTFWHGGTSFGAVVIASGADDGKQHHLTVTYDGTTQRSYVDGTLLSTSTVAQNAYGSGSQYAYFAGASLGAGWTAFPATDAAGWAYLPSGCGVTAPIFRTGVQSPLSSTSRPSSGGDPVPASQLTLYTGELLRLNQRLDPDTGALGRDARIASVDVDLKANTAEVALDNTRQNFEAFLARLSVVTNSRVQ